MSLISLGGQGSTEEQIEDFPEELILEIFDYLPPVSLGNCSQVSRTWQRISKDIRLWRKHCQQVFPGVKIPQGMSFKKFFISHSFASVNQLYKKIEAFHRKAIEGGCRSFTCSFPKHRGYSIDLKLFTKETTPETLEFDVEEFYIMLGKIENMGSLRRKNATTYSQFPHEVQEEAQKMHYFGYDYSWRIPEELSKRIYGYLQRIEAAPGEGLNGTDAFKFQDEV